MRAFEDVEFKTVDGTVLRGRLFPASRRGPGVVMCPGYNATKEMMGLPTTAGAFQAAGITALLYDHRGVGLSDGMPRNHIDPFQQVDDLSDAWTFLASHPSVDPRQGIGLWGMSVGATVAMVTAAVDPRPRFLVAVCPAVEIRHNMSKMPAVLAKAAKDRESQIKGNEPFYLPMLTAKGENPAGFPLGFEREAAMRLLATQDVNDPLRASLAPNHVNRTTVGTYRRMLMWDPGYMWKYINQPTLFILAENDAMVGTEQQLLHFESLKAPKRLHMQNGAAHMDVLECGDQEVVNKIQTDFVLEFGIGKQIKK